MVGCEAMTTTWTDSDRASWRYACTLSGMRNWWKGSDCVVVGGGPSAEAEDYWVHHDDTGRGWTRYDQRWTIACNRSVSFCSPDFAACFEPRHDDKNEEKGDVWPLVKAAGVPFVLSHIPRDHPRCVLAPAKETMRQATVAPSGFGQSVFFATYCAIMLGFETIGLIGLDLTRDRYPAKLDREEVAYAGLRLFANEQDCRLINLNPQSRLTSIPTGSWEEVRRK